MEWLLSALKVLPAGEMIRTWLDKRALRLTVHKACFKGNELEHYFVNVTNSSRNRELVITHVWFDLKPQIPVMPVERPLPKRLKPDEPWATWIPVDCVPSEPGKDARTLARARLSTGAVVKSKAEEHMPSAGAVPGS
jgi:hypothetical protein